MIKNLDENIEKLKGYLSYRDNLQYDIVELSKALALKNGVLLKENEDISKLKEMIPEKKHTLFILLDGFGYYKLKSLNDTSILKQNLRLKMKTVNPTSTAAVITSVISASYPNKHGIFGWWDYNKELDLSYYPLLLEQRRTGLTLKEKGISLDKIFNFKPVFDKYNKKVNIYMSRDLINSDYSKMLAGSNASRHGCYSIKEGFETMAKRLSEEEKETFNYFYIAGLDTASHMYGINSKEANEIIEATENGIKHLLNEVGDVTVILTADHGQVDMTSMLYLNQNINFTNYFYAMPSIDTRMVSFFVKDKFREEFEEKFIEEFGKDVILLKKEDIDKYNLFGSNNFSTIAYDSLGEYVAVIVNNKFMVCDRISLDDHMNTKGNHSGLTHEETTIPLVII